MHLEWVCVCVEGELKAVYSNGGLSVPSKCRPDENRTALSGPGGAVWSPYRITSSVPMFLRRQARLVQASRQAG